MTIRIVTTLAIVCCTLPLLVHSEDGGGGGDNGGPARSLPLLAVPLALLCVYFAVSIWHGRVWRFGTRLHHTLATLSAVAFLFILNYWNLLGYQFG